MVVKISLLITVYKDINPSWFEECMESVAKQKSYIAELVLVEDGPITGELARARTKWGTKLPIKSIKLAKNQGPGKAAQAGLERCSYEWVARLDADDIAAHDRFKTQIKALQDNPKLDVLGGYLPEFSEESGRVFAFNPLPLSHDKIARMMKHRCAINNCSVIFRKQKALEVGGYEALITHEDYLLWFKMFKAGAVFGNLAKTVGYVRTNKQSYGRRRGWFAIKQEFIFQNHLRKGRHISNFEYLQNIILRVPPRLLPSFLMRLFYITFLRKRIS